MVAAIYTGRYTPAEIAYVRDHYATRTRVQLAADLGRSVQSVRDLVHRYGFRKRPQLRRFRRRLLRLHEQGRLDTDMARVFRVSVRTVGRWRAALGLAVNYTLEVRRARTTAGQRQKARAMGHASWPEHLHNRRALACTRLWPGCITMMQVLCCRELAQGPRTVGTIAGARSLRYDSTHRALTELVAFGVVRRTVVRGLCRRWVHLYELLQRRPGEAFQGE